MARLREHYTKIVVPALTKDFGYKNIMAVPRIAKITINIGLGEATFEKNVSQSRCLCDLNSCRTPRRTKDG